MAVEFGDSEELSQPTLPSIGLQGGPPWRAQGRPQNPRKVPPEEVQSQRVGCSAKRKVKSQKVHSQTTKDC